MFYKEPTGVTVDGRDFGATSLASAGGFVKADMKAALDSGNTIRGFIHVPRPSPDPEETSPYPNIKYVYSLVGCKETDGDPFDYMKELNKQAWKSIDTFKVLTASWTAMSYPRFAFGETYLKKGSCVFKIAYFGASDWKVKYFDQHDEDAGKKVMPVKYMEQLDKSAAALRLLVRSTIMFPSFVRLVLILTHNSNIAHLPFNQSAQFGKNPIYWLHESVIPPQLPPK